jgi:uncharacterized protein
MKIGIISDTHGNLAGWERAMEVALADADLIIHCGDILYHGPKFRPAPGYDPLALSQAINACPVPVLIARGNADSDVDQLVIDVPIQQPYLFAQVEGLRVLATHGHLMPPDELLRLAARWRVDFVLTGHTHTPVIASHGDVVQINPGTTTYPLGQGSLGIATCATIVDGRAEVYSLESGEVVCMG